MQVADLHALEATIAASMPGDREAREETAAGVRGGASPVEARQPSSAHEAPARRVRAAVRQPGCLAEAQPIDAGNVGMRLLAKMGWEQGSGWPRPPSRPVTSVANSVDVHTQASDESSAPHRRLVNAMMLCS